MCVDDLVSDCWVLFIITDTVDVGRNGHFVVCKCELASFDGFMGIGMLLPAIMGCRGSVFVAVSFVVLFADGLGMGVFFLGNFALFGPGMLGIWPCNVLGESFCMGLMLSMGNISIGLYECCLGSRVQGFFYCCLWTVVNITVCCFCCLTFCWICSMICDIF